MMAMKVGFHTPIKRNPPKRTIHHSRAKRMAADEQLLAILQGVLADGGDDWFQIGTSKTAGGAYAQSTRARHFIWQHGLQLEVLGTRQGKHGAIFVRRGTPRNPAASKGRAPLQLVA